jgi:hypothetical protein
MAKMVSTLRKSDHGKAVNVDKIIEKVVGAGVI